ncbi:MAG TPA: hypothetical protein DIU39_07755 [Flavobacteriales bacterium]|nr:hypothetical protein [Flavobacteriales bacterium]
MTEKTNTRIMRLFVASIAILLFACSGNDSEQANVIFEEETEDTSFYYQDTTNYLHNFPEDTSGLSLEEQFYQKYISMYFDDDNYLVVTLRKGGVHFFDPHDSTEVAEVMKFKKFIEFRDTIPANEINNISLFSLEQKIDSLLAIME